MIGKGGFGEVFLAKICPTGRQPFEAAVKIPHNNDNNDLKQEALIFNLLQHVNILRLMGLIVDELNQNKGLVLEYCSGGPLNTWLKKNQNVLSLRNSIDWALQVANGMEYLHKRAPAKLLHRDLKSSNVLLLSSTASPEDQTLKISDFGLARARQEQRSLSQEQFSAAGTYAWMAPESIRSNNFSPYSDVWSFGVLVWEILTGEIPYRGLEPLQVAFSVAHRQMRLPIPSSIPATLAKLMNRCWEEDSQSRPEFDVIRELLEAARHEFQDYDKSGEFRSLQTTWKAEVRGMLVNLKEKAGELKSKEMELVEREKAVSRRQQDLQQRELDVVQREISVLLKEQTLESHHQKGKKKKKSKGDKIGSPRNFEHFVAVRRGDGGLKDDFIDVNYNVPLVMEPRGPGARTAKTWGHRNGEIVSNQINRHSSSTSDMDKVGLKQQYGHIKAAFAPATMICGAIGLSRDVFNVHAEIKKEPVKVVQDVKPVVPVPSTQNSIHYSDSSMSPSPGLSRMRRSAESTRPSRDHTPVTRPTASSPPGPECGRPRPRPGHQKPRGHRRVPSEPIELGDIDRVARELEHSNAIQKQEQLLNGTIMSETPCHSRSFSSHQSGASSTPPIGVQKPRRPQSAGPQVNSINLVTPIAIDNRSTSNPADWNNSSPLISCNSVQKSTEYNGHSFPGRHPSYIPAAAQRSTLPNSLIHIDPLNDDMIRFDPA